MVLKKGGGIIRFRERTKWGRKEESSRKKTSSLLEVTAKRHEGPCRPPVRIKGGGGKIAGIRDQEKKGKRNLIGSGEGGTK